MTGDELGTVRTAMLMTQAAMAQMCQAAGAMTATDIQTAESGGASTISNAALNTVCERLFRRTLDFVPGPYN